MNRTTRFIKNRINPDERGCLLDTHQVLLAQTLEEIRHVSDKITVPHMFILTNHEGVILLVNCNDDMIQLLEENNVGVGTSMSIDHSGINGISTAMIMGRTVLVRGTEHTFSLFHKWNCICRPIRSKEEIIGYLDLSFHNDFDFTFSIPLLEQLVSNISVI